MSKTKNRPAITVVVPIYNAEKFISKCVDSILKNTFSDFELLLIDDGSKDKSYSLIQSFTDSRITVSHHDNQGVSFTRNKGIYMASGEFIVFVDSDDYIDNDYLEKLYSKSTTSDIIVSGIKHVDTNGKIITQLPISNNEWQKFRLILSGGKMYRRQFLLDNNLSYGTLQIGEDVLFNVSIYAKTCRVGIVEYVGYNYVNNLESATKSKNKVFALSEIIDQIIDNCYNSPYIAIEDLSFILRKTLVDGILFNRKVLPISELKNILNTNINKIHKIYPKIFQFQSNDSFVVNSAVNVFAFFCAFHLLLPFLWVIKKL